MVNAFAAEQSDRKPAGGYSVAIARATLTWANVVADDKRAAIEAQLKALRKKTEASDKKMSKLPKMSVLKKANRRLMKAGSGLKAR